MLNTLQDIVKDFEINMCGIIAKTWSESAVLKYPDSQTCKIIVHVDKFPVYLFLLLLLLTYFSSCFLVADTYIV